MADIPSSPGFIENTVRAFHAIRMATMDSVKDLLVEDDPCLRAAAARYLHLLSCSLGQCPPAVVQSVRDALEECWHDEEHLGVLIVLEQCIDGHVPAGNEMGRIEQIRKSRRN